MESCNLYKRLLSRYGPRGWWPLISRAGRAGFNSGGYHPGVDYLPSTPQERFEVAAGAILTQNTAWKNVRTCIENLSGSGKLSAEGIITMDQQLLQELIRPSGYFRQKSGYLKNLAAFLSGWSLPGTESGPNYLADFNGSPPPVPARDALLSIKGVGEETADSILLYVYGLQIPVVDAYTRRILFRIGGSAFRNDSSIRDYMASCTCSQGEFHALFVDHGKEYCTSRTPRCGECFLQGDCGFSTCL